jgi:hypothetical protein
MGWQERQNVSGIHCLANGLSLLLGLNWIPMCWQMYEMCLKSYDLAILDNAFLVHAPGIKHIDPKEEKKRLPFIKRNNMVYNTILAKLRRKYGTKNQC